MNAIQGTVRNGEIVFDSPVSFREGTRVEVLPIETQRATVGMREDDWPTTAEGVAALLARMDKMEPGWLSPEDEVAWRGALRDERENDKLRSVEGAEELRRMWDGGMWRVWN